MFLTRALAVNGFPFEIKKANPYEALTEQEILDKLKKTREHAAQGMYKEAAEVSRGLSAMKEASRIAAENGISEMTLDEINKEISAVRR